MLTPAILAIGGPKFHLVGHSLGGWVASLITAENPQSILSLSLIDSAGLPPPKKSDFQHVLATGHNPLLVDEVKDFDRLLDFVFHHEPTIPWPGKSVLANQYVARAHVNERIWQDLTHETTDVGDKLSQIEAPVLILWGARDRIIDKSVVQSFQDHLKNEVVVMMNDCGHSPVTERPRESALYVAHFLSGADAIDDFDPSTKSTTALELPDR